jgi:hypothetical protein
MRIKILLFLMGLFFGIGSDLYAASSIPESSYINFHMFPAARRLDNALEVGFKGLHYVSPIWSVEGQVGAGLTWLREVNAEPVSKIMGVVGVGTTYYVPDFPITLGGTPYVGLSLVNNTAFGWGIYAGVGIKWGSIFDTNPKVSTSYGSDLVVGIDFEKPFTPPEQLIPNPQRAEKLATLLKEIEPAMATAAVAALPAPAVPTIAAVPTAPVVAKANTPNAETPTPSVVAFDMQVPKKAYYYVYKPLATPDSASHWAANDLQTMAGIGLLDIDNKGQSRPKASLTQGEAVRMAVLLKYYLTLLKKPLVSIAYSVSCDKPQVCSVNLSAAGPDQIERKIVEGESRAVGTYIQGWETAIASAVTYDGEFRFRLTINNLSLEKTVLIIPLQRPLYWNSVRAQEAVEMGMLTAAEIPLETLANTISKRDFLALLVKAAPDIASGIETVDPDKNISRAEAVTILGRMLKK